jgi:hypothetical protein
MARNGWATLVMLIAALALVALFALTAGCNALSGANEVVFGCADECSDAALLADAADATGDVSTLALDAALVEAGDADASPPPLCDSNDSTLVFCLPFDGDAIDRSGKPLPTTVSNVTFGAGRVGQAASFATGFVESPHAPTLDVASVTMEAFVSPKTLPAPAARHGILDSNGRFSLFLMPSGSVACSAGPGADATTAGLPTGKLTHIACTASGGILTLYVDGAVVASAVAGPIPVNANGIAVGRNDPSGDFFDGTIDELRIYSRVRSPAEIAAAAMRGK